MQRLELDAALAALLALADAGRLGSSDSFARDLCRKAARGLSGKQIEWVYRLIERTTAPAAAPLVGDIAPIVGLFARARAAGLKYPKVRLATADGQRVVLAQCGERSKTPGDLRVTDGGSFDSGRYFGRIAAAGTWHAGRDSTPSVLALLSELAQDPAGTASVYGRRTGACCFCGLALKDGRSVAVGYGPICADKYGLPWGETSAPAIAVDTTGTAVIDPTHPDFA